MRKLLLVAVTLLIIAVVYIGFAVRGLAALADAVRERNAASVVERVDLNRVKQSLTQQIVATYLERMAQTKRVSSRDQWIANTVGGSIADAMLSRVLVPDKIVMLLNDGRIAASADHPEIVVPRLADVSMRGLAAELSRVRVVQPTEFAVRLSRESEEFYGIRMHLDGSGWRLSSIDLPPMLLKELAAKLPRG